VSKRAEVEEYSPFRGEKEARESEDTYDAKNN
jgi:hypothetical protein